MQCGGDMMYSATYYFCIINNLVRIRVSPSLTVVKNAIGTSGGVSPSGKAAFFGNAMRRFESFYSIESLHRLVWPRTISFHEINRGSNPLGDTKGF